LDYSRDVLAKKVEIYCGDLKLPWGWLGMAVDTVVNTTRGPDGGSIWEETLYITILTSTIVKLCEERKQRDKGLDDAKESLILLLQRYRHLECADTRDRIFGLLSFAPPCCSTANSVDYTCSAFVLCNRLLEHHVQSHSKMGEAAGYSCNRKRSPYLDNEVDTSLSNHACAHIPPWWTSRSVPW